MWLQSNTPGKKPKRKIKSVHFQRAKLKHFLQSRKYIYFWTANFIWLKRKALFIINPISGGKRKDRVPDLIQNNLNLDLFSETIVFSDGVNHAREITNEKKNDYDLIVAVGGDGTINEIASALTCNDIPLGIIPYGSGNGLSRFLGIPMNTEKAIQNLNNWKIERIDSATLNGLPFFNMAGMGFDAHISEVFSGGMERGFFNYIKSSVVEFNKYRSQTYNLTIDGVKFKRDAFMISFANSSQYGNNAHISPGASVQDGLIDVCIIKQFPFWRLLEMGLRMLTKTSEQTKYVEIMRGKNIIVEREQDGPVHVDGEPMYMGTSIEIAINSLSLNVMVGENFKKN